MKYKSDHHYYLSLQVMVEPRWCSTLNYRHQLRSSFHRHPSSFHRHPSSFHRHLSSSHRHPSPPHSCCHPSASLHSTSTGPRVSVWVCVGGKGVVGTQIVVVVMVVMTAAVVEGVIVFFAGSGDKRDFF